MTHDAAAARRARRERARHEPVPPSVHGTINGYTNYACRCLRCRVVNANYQRVYRETRTSLPIPASVQHGTVNCYANYGCRCQPCRDEKSRVYRTQRIKRRATGEE